MPVYDFGKNNRTGECTSVGPADVVIVEGIMVLHLEAIRWEGGSEVDGRERDEGAGEHFGARTTAGRAQTRTVVENVYVGMGGLWLVCQRSHPVLDPRRYSGACCT